MINWYTVSASLSCYRLQNKAFQIRWSWLGHLVPIYFILLKKNYKVAMLYTGILFDKNSLSERTSPPTRIAVRWTLQGKDKETWRQTALKDMKSRSLTMETAPRVAR